MSYAPSRALGVHVRCIFGLAILLGHWFLAFSRKAIIHIICWCALVVFAFESKSPAQSQCTHLRPKNGGDCWTFLVDMTYGVMVQKNNIIHMVPRSSNNKKRMMATMMVRIGVDAGSDMSIANWIVIFVLFIVGSLECAHFTPLSHASCIVYSTDTDIYTSSARVHCYRLYNIDLVCVDDDAWLWRWRIPN